MFIYKSDRAVVAWVFQLFLQGRKTIQNLQVRFYFRVVFLSKLTEMQFSESIDP